MSESRKDDWDWLINGLRSGDDEAIGEFVSQFGTPLERIAANRISPNLQKRFGAQSVALSVVRTFVRRSGEGLVELEDSDAMWRLLCAITLTKVREKVRFHRREKRDVGREAQPLPPGENGASVEMQHASTSSSPADEVAFADALEHLMSGLDEEERQLLDFKMRQIENDVIAEEMDCSERTVRRMLGRLQAKFELQL